MDKVQSMNYSALRVRFFDTTDDIMQNRPFELYRPCSCGCDERDGEMAGYLNVISDGQGMTIIIEDEATYRKVAEAMGILLV